MRGLSIHLDSFLIHLQLSAVLKNLKRINLTNTLFDEEFIQSFNQFPALEKVYLFQEDRDLSKNLILNDKQKNLLAFGSLILEEL